MKTWHWIILALLAVLAFFVGLKIFKNVKEKKSKGEEKEEKSEQNNNGEAAVFDGTKEAFVKAIKPYAKAINKETGIPTMWIIAHQALETGWGKSSLVKEAFNFGGIKAREGQDYVLKPTYEHVSDYNKFPDRLEFKSKTGEKVRQERVSSGKWKVRIKAKFAKYKDVSDGLQGYKKILLLKRYEACLGEKDALKYGSCIMSKGYGTDVNYMSKVSKVLTIVEDIYPTV